MTPPTPSRAHGFFFVLISLLTALDKKNSETVFEIFQKLAGECHQTLLIVTHDLAFAQRTHRTIEMEDGRILRQ